MVNSKIYNCKAMWDVFTVDETSNCDVIIMITVDQCYAVLAKFVIQKSITVNN